MSARSVPDAPGASSPCPHFPHCAACAFSGVPYGAQLRAKRERLVECLRGCPALASVPVPAVVGSPRVFGYRNQAKLAARRAGRRLLLGVYRPGTHQVVDISRCPVHQPPIPAVLDAVHRELERAAAPTYDERTGSGWLRYVLVRASAWKRSAQLILVIRGRDWRGEPELLRRLRRLRGVSSLIVNVNAAPGNVILGERFITVQGDPALVERIGGLHLRSSPGAFLQANVGTARRLYEQVLRWADPQPEDVAVDLYCGVGALSFYLAGTARQVIGIEESPIAVRDANQNIRLNGYHNVRFVAAPSAEGLRRVAATHPRIDCITLNPPRKGVDVETRITIAACAPARVVYVSCDPGTLARDLGWLAEHGYAITALQPYDLLPQTEHVETVALLRRTDRA
jgi:23S rRNA (uracil1939-C5)-methyltransferase